MRSPAVAAVAGTVAAVCALEASTAVAREQPMWGVADTGLQQDADMPGAVDMGIGRYPVVQ
jgi:hypothetical protein